MARRTGRFPQLAHPGGRLTPGKCRPNSSYAPLTAVRLVPVYQISRIKGEGVYARVPLRDAALLRSHRNLFGGLASEVSCKRNSEFAERAIATSPCWISRSPKTEWRE